MFIVDVPYVPAEQPPIVVAGGTSTATNAGRQPSFILKECQGVPSRGDPRSAQRSVDPAGALRNYIENRDNRVLDLATFKNPTLVEGPKHGKIFAVEYGEGRSFHYDPSPEYIGKDRAVFTVEYKGQIYKIVIDFVVDFTIGEEEEYDVPYCPKPKLIRIKKPVSGSSGLDLLSVLLHEYGHALGIEHSADAHDYMASTLQPGVRRLPNAEDQPGRVGTRLVPTPFKPSS